MGGGCCKLLAPSLPPSLPPYACVCAYDCTVNENMNDKYVTVAVIGLLLEAGVLHLLHAGAEDGRVPSDAGPLLVVLGLGVTHPIELRLRGRRGEREREGCERGIKRVWWRCV